MHVVFCFFINFLGFIVTEAKLPLYAFKSVDKVEGKELPLLACNNCPVAFLDNLILGEVIIIML